MTASEIITERATELRLLNTANDMHIKIAPEMSIILKKSELNEILTNLKPAAYSAISAMNLQRNDVTFKRGQAIKLTPPVMNTIMPRTSINEATGIRIIFTKADTADVSLKKSDETGITATDIQSIDTKFLKIFCKRDFEGILSVIYGAKTPIPKNPDTESRKEGFLTIKGLNRAIKAAAMHNELRASPVRQNTAALYAITIITAALIADIENPEQMTKISDEADIRIKAVSFPEWIFLRTAFIIEAITIR